MTRFNLFAEVVESGGSEEEKRGLSMRIAGIALLIVFCMCFTLSAFAQDYPARPVTVIIPFTAGSATDAIARMVGDKLSEVWGQPVVYENRPGAGGTVGIDAVAKSPEDGYTLLFASSGFVSSPALYATLPYDPMKDFIDVAPLARQAMVIFVGEASATKSVSELIEAAKAKPGTLKYGSPGVGSGAHLAAEKFNRAAGIDVIHTPKKGGPETIAVTADGSAAYAILPIAAVLKGMEKGQVRPLAVTSAQRSGLMPDVPSAAEAGIAGFEETLWWGVWTPAGTPSSVVEKLAGDIAKALSSPDMLEQMEKRGFEPMSMGREEFSRFVRSEMESVAKTVKDAGIALQ